MCAKAVLWQPRDITLRQTLTNVDGLFTAGTSMAPMSVYDTVNHAKAAAFAVRDYLNNKK